jgi:hypothetical protein
LASGYCGLSPGDSVLWFYHLHGIFDPGDRAFRYSIGDSDMQLVRRPLAPQEFNHELVWLCVSLGGVVAAAVWLKLGLPWPACVFRALTGHPCLTCGATRSAIAFFHANFLTALKWNPLLFGVYVAITLFDVYAFAVLVLRAPRFRVVGVTAAERNLARCLVVVVVAINWGYLLMNSRRFV